MKKNIKIFLIIVLVFGIAAISFVDTYNRNKNLEAISSKLTSEIAPLNAKYNLIAAEPLVDSEGNKLVASVLNSGAFRASVIDNGQKSKNIIVKLDDESKKNRLENLLLLTLQTDLPLSEVTEDYEELASVEYAEEDFEIELDDLELEAFSLKAENFEVSLDEVESESEPIVVAMIDSGVDTSHPELRGRFVDGYDFVERKDETVDEVGHGTHVAGIIIGQSKNALIMPIKFTNGRTGRTSHVVKSIKYAAEQNVDILNLSIGLTDDSKSLREAVEYAQEKNVLIIAASGNKNSDEKYYPAAWSKVIAVSAVDRTGEKTENSNYGSWVDFSALGKNVYSTAPGNSYKYRTGTSQAAPLVTARAADYLHELITSEKLNKEEAFEKVYEELESHSGQVKGRYTGQMGRLVN